MLEVKDAALVEVEHHKLCGEELRDLAAELRADGARGAGYEHHTAVEELLDLLGVDPGRVAPQEVFHAHLFEVAEGEFLAEKFGVFRHDLDIRNSSVPRDLHGLADELRVVALEGDNDVFHIMVVDEARQVADGAQNGDAVDQEPLIRRLLIHDAYDAIEARRAQEVSDKVLALAAGTYDERGLAVRYRAVRKLKPEALRDAEQADEEDAHEITQEDDRTRETGKEADGVEKHEQSENAGGIRERAEEARELLEAHKGPREGVHPLVIKEEQGQARIEQEVVGEACAVFGGKRSVEAQEKRDDERYRGQRRVGDAEEDVFSYVEIFKKRHKML